MSTVNLSQSFSIALNGLQQIAHYLNDLNASQNMLDMIWLKIRQSYRFVGVLTRGCHPLWETVDCKK